MNIYTSISELVGKTPLLEPRNYAQAHRLNARLLLKLDHLNPAGSMKDRIALAMINEAEASGQLQSGSVIIEPNQRQHGHWPGGYCRFPGIPHHSYHAGKHER